MDIVSAPTTSSGTPWPGVALGIMGITLNAISWVHSGQLSHLLGALAFAAITPAWYFTPISFTGPLSSNWKRRRLPMPRWAQILALTGFVLLGASFVVKVAT